MSLIFFQIIKAKNVLFLGSTRDDVESILTRERDG